MPSGIARMTMMIGSVAYIAIFALALTTNLIHGKIFSFLTLSLITQTLLGIPFLLFLFRGTELPLLDYAKWFVALVVVLAVSGLLGIPDNVNQYDPVMEAIEADGRRIQAKKGNKDRLALKVKLAGAEDDDDRKEIQKEIDEVGDDLSKEDKEDLDRDMAVAHAEGEEARFNAGKRAYAFHLANQRNSLVIIAAFLILAGAWIQKNGG